MRTFEEVKKINLQNLEAYIDNGLVDFCPFTGNSITIPFDCLPFQTTKEALLNALDEIGYTKLYQIEVITEDHEEIKNEETTSYSTDSLRFTPIFSLKVSPSTHEK